MCPTKIVKKISVATAFCPLVSFVRTPRTKKKTSPKRKSNGPNRKHRRSA